MPTMNTQHVRCHCCGEWLLVLNWDRSKPTYCENCRVENDPAWRTGAGRGQCAYCREYPSTHWRDPKPVPSTLHIYVR
jgi:hypothetical protein